MSPGTVTAASVAASADLPTPATRVAHPLGAFTTRAWGALAGIVRLRPSSASRSCRCHGCRRRLPRLAGPRLRVPAVGRLRPAVPVPAAPDSQVRLRAYSDHLNVLWRGGQGLSIWVVEDVLANPCMPDGPLATRAPGADGLIAYLRSVQGLDAHRPTLGHGRRPPRDGDDAHHPGLRMPRPGIASLARRRVRRASRRSRSPQVELVPITIVDVDWGDGGDRGLGRARGRLETHRRPDHAIASLLQRPSHRHTRAHRDAPAHGSRSRSRLPRARSPEPRTTSNPGHSTSSP